MSKKLLLMDSPENENKYNNESLKEKDEKSLKKEEKNDSFDVKINEKKTDYDLSQNSDSQNNSYSIIPVNNQENSSEILRTNHISKKRKRKIIKKRNYFQNICKIKSIIGLFLNLIFWIWSIFYILNLSRIIIFPRGSLYNRKVHTIYSMSNSDSIFGQIISTLINTILTYYIVYIYPEVILFVSYLSYLIYSLFNMQSDKFNRNKFCLSKKFYIILVLLSFGEVYKLFARKYLDI